MACYPPIGVKPLSKPMLGYCKLDLRNKLKWNFKENTFHSWKCIWKYRLWNGGYFVQGEMSELSHTPHCFEGMWIMYIIAHGQFKFGIGFNHGMLGLAENPARGTGFWSQNTEGVARGALTEKTRPEGWIFSQAQHPMIKTYYSMFLHCNRTIIVFNRLATVEWKRQRADISSRHCC